MTLKSGSKHEIEKYTNPCMYSVYEVLLLHGTNCHICGLPIDFSVPRQAYLRKWENGLHLDHVIPLSKGGSDKIENVKPSHGKCNQVKGNRIIGSSPPIRHKPRYKPSSSILVD